MVWIQRSLHPPVHRTRSQNLAALVTMSVIVGKYRGLHKLLMAVYVYAPLYYDKPVAQHLMSHDR